MGEPKVFGRYCLKDCEKLNLGGWCFLKRKDVGHAEKLSWSGNIRKQWKRCPQCLEDYPVEVAR